MALLAQTVAFYGLHLAALVVGFLWLRRMHHRQGLSRLGWARPAVGLFVMAGLVFAISEPQREWFGDFVEAYYQGGATALRGLDEIPKEFERGVHGFVNIPILALPFVPFALVGEQVGAGLYLLLGILAVVGTWRLIVVGFGLDRYGALLVALLFALNGPLLNSIREGNTSHMALFAVTLAFCKLRAGRDVWAGALIGAAALFKLPLLLFGLFFLVRGRWGALVGSGLVVGGVGLLSIVLFGLEPHVHWYESFVAPASERPIGAFNVQSVPATLLRFEHAHAVICDWGGRALAPSGRWLSRLASLMMLGAVVVAALLPAWRGPGRVWRIGSSDFELEYLCVFVLACVMSPLAWSHYYCWMLLPLTVLLLAPEYRQLLGRDQRWAVVAIVAVGAPVLRPWCTPSGFIKAPYLVALSHYLLGGLLCLGLLALCRFRSGLRPHE